MNDGEWTSREPKKFDAWDNNKYFERIIVNI